ncbi:ABC transporter ATP-binding protein [Corynebacterium renale]|uniref:ABC-type multidrug transport system fused ATPase/permease subunit n=3 Tax=Corynebacterium renale TaxID=1724 RepID=A0A2A9DP73_9CORY|nr:ABC transporter ATP-binding protein [Corynebacterium renale]PFG28181.1 ABC-type multidrug transport system fused ATPase/permease subunit [Corynebacterium renale]SQI20160.1 putative transport system, ATP-binding protein [Corynebacterium renale]
MNRLQLTRWLFSHIRDLIPAFWISSLARILGQLAGVGLLVAAVLAVSTPWSLWAAVLVIAVIALVKAGLRYLEHYSGHWLAFTALKRLRALFFTRLIPQAPQATSGKASAELTGRAVEDINKIEVFFAHTFPPVISAITVPIIVVVTFGFTTSWPLALIMAIFLAVIIALPFLWMPVTFATARKVAAAESGVTTHVGDDIAGIREILTFHAQDARLEGLRVADERLTTAGRTTSLLTTVREVITVALQLGLLVSLMSYDAPWEHRLLALAIAVALALPTRSVDDFANGLDAAFASAERIYQVIEGTPAVTDGPGAEFTDDTVTFDDVTLSYDGAPRNALESVTAVCPAGQWTALVGVSGSGKSSLAALLLRGWDPQSGEVRIGDVPVTQATLDQLRSHVAIVSQRAVTISGTVAENLRLGNPDASDAQLTQALQVVDLDVDLGQRIGRGSTLSGGQLQRLTLARALVVQPRILVLDEALSQLDAKTAATVRTNVEHMGLTVLEITHRTDLLPEDTRVYVLDNGAVVEHGNVATLRGAGGPFDALEARVRE